jgi:hypothetical protein
VVGRQGRCPCRCLFHSFVDLLDIVIVDKRTAILGTILTDVPTCADESLATPDTGNPLRAESHHSDPPPG